MNSVIAFPYQDTQGAKTDPVRGGGIKDLDQDQIRNAIQSGSLFLGRPEDKIEAGPSRRFDFDNGFSARIVEQGIKGFAALMENKTKDGGLEFTPGTKAVALKDMHAVANFLKAVGARPDHENARKPLREDTEEFELPQNRPMPLSREKIATLQPRLG